MCVYTLYRHSDICNEQFCLSDPGFGAGRCFDHKGHGVESNDQTIDRQLAKMNWWGINGKCAFEPLAIKDVVLNTLLKCIYIVS